MFNYELYTLDEFLEDSWFREWVLHPTPPTEAFWNDWMQLHPDKKPLIDQARAVLRALEMPHQSVSRTEITDAVDATFRRLHQEPRYVVRTLPQQQWGWAAAAVLLLIGLGSYVFFYVNTSTKNATSVAATSVPSTDLLTQRNDTKQPKRLTLPDGSEVVLSPRSSLSYPGKFNGNERRTYLKGDAFFEITRNPAKPFLVVTDKLVTRVLGTSFWVRTNSGNAESRVVVRTGKVSVFKTDDLAQTTKKPEGVVLLPNQQVVFFDETNRLTKSIVEQPVPIQKPVHNQEFSYSEAPASQIFGDLAKAYGILIVYDEDVLKHCQITATLGEEPLFDTLTLLCNSIHASYEVIDTQIVIYSKGCK
ncbi:FecR domain-containing protein [Spirosoma sp. BT702]|uniref:FecR domain-containing protein n=1 Tax=Spirosoma profusum TaxID=2771354 RepID=A0A926XYL8_9BACT|nr:FecR family protein [Spirosoma profusum]MBD2700487.1 FecR domain-containing protein [Spirosoma profusum]